MKIAVLLKQVPDTNAKIVVSGDRVDLSSLKMVMSPYDEFALEQARLLKEQLGDGSVTAVTIGPKDAQKEMRSTLARGAGLMDRAPWTKI